MRLGRGALRGVTAGAVNTEDGLMSSREEIEAQLRERFEEALKPRIEQEIENTRDEREEKLAEELEERYRDEFERTSAAAMTPRLGRSALPRAFQRGR